jgi:MFS transporter, DHA1 family, inner membrane transport protein
MAPGNTKAVEARTATYSLAAVTFWLASGAFAFGASEFAAMSLLPYYARSFGVPEEIAGHAISAYALGVVVGAPVIAIVASRLPRKHVLIALMGIFALGNALTVLAASDLAMDATRFLSGLPHGGYFGIAMLFAADIAGKDYRARAVSHIMIGLAVSNVVGVPIVNAIGQYFGWRSGFALIAALSCLTMLMIWRTAPYKGANSNANPLSELKALGNRDVLLALTMGTIGFGGMFAVYSYFSAAYLATTHAPEWGVSVILVVFGLGITAGNYLAGLLAGGRVLWAAAAMQAVLGLAAAFYAISVGNVWLMGAAMFFAGFGGGLVVPLQTRLMDVAGEAQTMAAASIQAAFNLGNAIGPWLAGLVLAAGFGWRSAGWVGMALSVGGLLIWAGMLASDNRRGRT